MSLSPEELLVIARQYWPAPGTEASEENGPEHARRALRWNEALRDNERWNDFLKDLRGLFPGFSVGDGTSTSQACFTCVLFPAKGYPIPPVPWAVVGSMSILAPVFTVYGITFAYEGSKRSEARIHVGPMPDAMAETAARVAQELEARFKVRALPEEVAATPAPVVVEGKKPPHTTLFDALFTSEPDNVL
ncbi:hypothetical protein [Corallococcus terminator]|uniref:Uncharacterized protein n=1 Tax=Corallococcus terminator TaxID=2316733 RepID=A0A3A8JR21_9BACT|nr:hypothetical protein [Corallococcus terminator]RKG92871.1 hypothetical protein D7V88_04715 [Corallococcus terminator]